MGPAHFVSTGLSLLALRPGHFVGTQELRHTVLSLARVFGIDPTVVLMKYIFITLGIPLPRGKEPKLTVNSLFTR